MRLLSAVALAIGVSACGAPPATVRGAFDAPGLPRVDVTIAIPPEHRGDAVRYQHAAFTTLKILGTWMTPFPDATLSVEPEPTPWWTAPASMAPEFAVARVVSRRYWERVVDTRALPPWFVGGLAEYSARRAVSKIVDERYQAVYRARAEGRYFGGFVPRDLGVRLPVEDEGDRMFLFVGTLERWVGHPVFDAILMEFVRASAGTHPALDDFARVASRVSGQDLSWLVDETLKTSGVFDYGIAAFDSRLQPDGAFRTTVDVRRFGAGVFSGATAVPDAPFEQGRGILVLTTFADGETVRDTWDGRSRSRTFEYRSPSRAVSAEVDPDRVLLLDVNRSNNGVTLATGPSRTAANRWAARWMIWLEDALLTYAALT